MHGEDPAIKSWLQGRMESTCNTPTLSRDEKLRILQRLTDAETLETFLHRKYIGKKRFSLEGGESLIPLLDWLIDEFGAQGGEEVVLGMAHRGRLNVLVNVLGKNLKELFAEFEDTEVETMLGRGDVKYHLGYSTDRRMPDGRNLHLSLAFNPSHLEIVDPVVEGRVRAKQDRNLNWEGAPRNRDPEPAQGAAGADPRRCGLRRAGRGGGSAQPRQPGRVRHRRHRPRDHQQPGGLHHQPRGRALHALLHGHRPRAARSGLPRQRRGPGGGDLGGAARRRLPAAVPAGRAHRPVLLPQVRPQRGRRACLHPAASCTR